MKVVICNEFADDAEAIKEYLKASPILKDGKFVTYSSGEKLINDIIQGESFDLAFLDADTTSSDTLDAAAELQRKFESFMVMFIAANANNASLASDSEKFPDFYKFFLNNEGAQRIIDNLRMYYKKARATHAIRLRSGSRIVRINDILYVERCQKHVVYHTVKEVFETAETLTQVFEVLKDYGFHRVHQGFIVNFDKVSCFDKNGMLFQNGYSVPVSKNKRLEVVEAYCQYTDDNCN